MARLEVELQKLATSATSSSPKTNSRGGKLQAPPSTAPRARRAAKMIQPHQNATTAVVVPDEILTPDGAGQLLKMTRRQVYGMTRRSARARMPIPIPMMNVNGNIRFRRSALEQWLRDLELYERSGRLPVCA